MHDLDRVVLETNDEWDGVDDETYGDPVETLLAVDSDEELEQFFSGLMRSASRLARRSVPPTLRAPLTRYLKGAAAAALPQVGSAIGRFAGSQFGEAQAGARAGRRIASALRSRETEYGDIAGDGEREAARQVVNLAERISTEATRVAPSAGKSAAATVVKRAEAAVVPAGPPRTTASAPGGPRSGTWTKRGHTITLDT